MYILCVFINNKKCLKIFDCILKFQIYLGFRILISKMTTLLNRPEIDPICIHSHFFGKLSENVGLPSKVYTTAGLFRMTMILGCSSIDCFTSSHHLFFCCSYCMLEFQIYPEFCDFWVQNDVHNRENIFMLFCGQGVIFRMCANKTIVYAKVWCFAELQSLFFMGLSYWKICAPPLEKVCRRCGQSGDQWRRHTFQSGRAGGGTQLIRKSIKRSKSGSAQHP